MHFERWLLILRPHIIIFAVLNLIFLIPASFFLHHSIISFFHFMLFAVLTMFISENLAKKHELAFRSFIRQSNNSILSYFISLFVILLLCFLPNIIIQYHYNQYLYIKEVILMLGFFIFFTLRAPQLTGLKAG